MAHLTYRREEVAKRGHGLHETLRSQVELPLNINKLLRFGNVTK